MPGVDLTDQDFIWKKCEEITGGKKDDQRWWEIYMSSAEKFLYGELAVVMEIPRDKVSGYVKEHLDAELA